MATEGPTSSNSVPGTQNLRADVLVVVVTKVEAQAVLQLFEKHANQKSQIHHIGEKTYFDLGIVGGARIAMVVSEMGAVGLGASLQTVQAGISVLSPSAIIMVGIAFGI